MRRIRRTKSLAAQTIDLGFAVPQVIAHRVARIIIAGGSPSARDRRELHRMGAEKILAANEAWSAMAIQTVLENQKLAFSFMQSLWFPFSGGCIRTPLREGATMFDKRQCCAAYPLLTILHGLGSIAVWVDRLGSGTPKYFL